MACGNFENIGGEDIRADSPTAEQEGIALFCSWATSLGLCARAADITSAYFQGIPLENYARPTHCTSAETHEIGT